MMSRILLAGLLLVGVSNSSPQASTVAFMTSAAASTSNQFSVGTLHIAQSVSAGTTLSMDNLLAGDDFDAQLDVSNVGTLSLVYSIGSTIVGNAALGDALQLTVRAKSSTPCSARDGSVLYTGPLSSAAVGDPSHGIQPGDRTLAPGNSESLCFTVVLPSTATPDLSGQSVSATFTAIAEQS
jgi:hypothetical protein